MPALMSTSAAVGAAANKAIADDNDRIHLLSGSSRSPTHGGYLILGEWSEPGAESPAARPPVGTMEPSGRSLRPQMGQKYLNFRLLGLFLFALAGALCLYKVYLLLACDAHATPQPPTPGPSRTTLKLVSVFNRHGDRAPSDKLPLGDRHALNVSLFWPHGLTNLTDAGRLRQFRIGLELRRRYHGHLDYNATHFLALSSPIYRCRESLEQILRGLFDIESTTRAGRRLIQLYTGHAGTPPPSACFDQHDQIVHNQSMCTTRPALGKRRLPGGSGSPDEWRQIRIDSDTLPTLTWLYLTNCKYRRAHPTPVDDNLQASPAVARLRGIRKLVNLLKSRYQMDLNFTALGHWSTIANELRLARTRDTISYTSHFADWINLPLPEYDSKVAMFDFYEQVVLLGYRDRIQGLADRIQLGPMFTSLLTSQLTALERKPSSSVATDPASDTDDESAPVVYDDPRLYRNKRMIVYSSHDSILQSVLERLQLIQFEPAEFGARYEQWHRADDVDQLLAGLRMSKFGMSLVFELHEAEQVDGLDRARFAFVQALLYNREDAKYTPIEYRRLGLGAACERVYRALHSDWPQAHVDAQLERFYAPAEQLSLARAHPALDRHLSCPFELFRHVLERDYTMAPAELRQLCE